MGSTAADHDHDDDHVASRRDVTNDESPGLTWNSTCHAADGELLGMVSVSGRLIVMSPAHGCVVLVGAELDLRARHGGDAVHEPQVADRLLRTVLAGDLDLFDPIGEL